MNINKVFLLSLLVIGNTLSHSIHAEWPSIKIPDYIQTLGCRAFNAITNAATTVSSTIVQNKNKKYTLIGATAISCMGLIAKRICMYLAASKQSLLTTLEDAKKQCSEKARELTALSLDNKKLKNEFAELQQKYAALLNKFETQRNMTSSRIQEMLATIKKSKNELIC
jgi:regulator of replication initiation timing